MNNLRLITSDAATREPSTRSFLGDWTVDRLRSAEAQADYGSLRLAGEVCEALLTDDRVKGVLGARTRGLAGLPLTFEEGRGLRRRRARALRALEAEEDFWAAFPEESLVQLLTWGALLGVGLARLVPTERPSGRVVPRLEVRDPRWLRFDPYTREWWLTVDGGAEVLVTPGDGTWLLYTPEGSNRPWAHGAWRACSRWWLSKHYAREDFAHASEVFGQPIRVGTAPEGTTAEKRKELARDLQRLGRNTSLALPPGYDLKLVEATGRTHEMFDRQIELANVALAIVLVGQNLSTEVQGGSFAAASVHASVRGDIIRADGETLSTCLHDQALTWWAEWNFGDAQLAPWPAWATDPPEDRAAKLDGLTKFAQAAGPLDTAGVDVRALAEELGYPLKPLPPPPAAPVPALVPPPASGEPPASQ
jgi:hypothetical protein